MRRAEYLILLLLMSAGSSQACELEEIAALSGAEQAWDFEQEKDIESLSRPIRSSGQLWLQGEGTLVWQVQKPVSSTLVINDSGLRQYDAQDELQSTESNPQIAELSGVFLALLNGDHARLQENFDIRLDCDDSGAWTAQLTPTDSRLSALLHSLTLAGSTGIESLSFREQRGDVTRISLQAVARVPEFDPR